MRAFTITAFVFALLFNHMAFAVEETLQNDGFSSGDAVTFQLGFVAGEIGAARFEPQITCPCVLDTVTLLFGGSTDSQIVGISVWDDSTGDANPGNLLFSGEVTLAGSNVNLQEIDLTLTPIPINGPFRVGIEFTHDGPPAIATDLDGDIDASANFILANLGGPSFWFPATTLGVSGDFVIRATIDNLSAVDTDGDGVTDDLDNCTTVANSDQRDSNGDGFGNTCDGDLTNDCIINFADIAAFAAVFLQTGNLDADLNGDGTVAFLDFVMLTGAFMMPPGPSGVPNSCDPILSSQAIGN